MFFNCMCQENSPENEFYENFLHNTIFNRLCEVLVNLQCIFDLSMNINQ